MKRVIRWTWLAFAATILAAPVLPAAWGATPAASQTSAPTAGYLENITFEKLPGKERVTLAVSKQSGVSVESQTGNTIAIRMENLFVPEGLRRSLGEGALANVVRVTPLQRSAEGRSWVLATVELKQKVPFSVRQEGMNVLVDFNVTTLASAADPVRETPPAPAQSASQKTAPAPATVPPYRDSPSWEHTSQERPQGSAEWAGTHL